MKTRESLIGVKLVYGGRPAQIIGICRHDRGERYVIEDYAVDGQPRSIISVDPDFIDKLLQS